MKTYSKPSEHGYSPIGGHSVTWTELKYVNLSTEDYKLQNTAQQTSMHKFKFVTRILIFEDMYM